ncbi:hypothetical protein MVEN_01886000 [Mycena venus]|uniref:Uncharacterized protein n=1 Tax=Mycena venus TaxID=2733690 RepID=A0A8H7CMI1_9AGAR|nr:hypothetical protein MVEN_01886000 [Mycena venus]
MFPKFLVYGLAALALVRATSFQVNFAVSFDTAVTAGVEAGNYYLVNVGTNETLFGVGKGQPVYTSSVSGTPGPLAQWKVEIGAGPNEYKFINIGLGYTTSANNGQLYVSYGPGGDRPINIVTQVQGNADTFTITLSGYGTWSSYWDTYYKRTQVGFAKEYGKPRTVVEIRTCCLNGDGDQYKVAWAIQYCWFWAC